MPGFILVSASQRWTEGGGFTSLPRFWLLSTMALDVLVPVFGKP